MLHPMTRSTKLGKLLGELSEGVDGEQTLMSTSRVQISASN